MWIPHQVRNDGERERRGLERGERAPTEVGLVIGMHRGEVIRYEANGDTRLFSTLEKLAEIDK